jgi:putative membrane protein
MTVLMQATAFLAHPGWGWDGGWGGWGGWGWWFAPLWILPWLVFVGVAIWLLSRGGGSRWQRSGTDRAREILAERFARGELSSDEYRERLDQLG